MESAKEPKEHASLSATNVTFDLRPQFIPPYNYFNGNWPSFRKEEDIKQSTSEQDKKSSLSRAEQALAQLEIDLAADDDYLNDLFPSPPATEEFEENDSYMTANSEDDSEESSLDEWNEEEENKKNDEEKEELIKEEEKLVIEENVEG